MKVILVSIVLFFASLYSKAQEVTNWEAYLKDSIYQSDEKDFIFLNKTKGGIKVKFLKYSFKGGQYVITTIYGDTLVETKIVVAPNLFKILYDHYDNLIKLPKYLHKEILNSFHFKELYYDSSVTFLQLAISYYGLHLVHIQKFSEEQIIKAGKNIADAMIVVNELYRILETFESKQKNYELLQFGINKNIK